MKPSPDATGKANTSPCIQVCELTLDQICRGCGRSLEEIAAWSQADDVSRKKIVKLARQRLNQGIAS